MVPEVLVATPLNYSVATRPYEFPDGISIRELSPILWDISVVKGYISEADKARMNGAKYWLCASEEQKYVLHEDGQELYDKARNAALALQLIAPSGAMHVFLKFQRTNSGYGNIGALHLKELCQTFLGKFMSADKLGLERDFELVYAGISRAFNEKVVRFQNPVILLEQGMQSGHIPLATLMFVMGLEMLFMAGGTKTFVRRLGGFLGVDSYVFPPLSRPNLQQNTIVRDVLNDLYEFRNIIAHGQEIPESPYRQSGEFMSTEGLRINYEDCCRVDLLFECLLFLLTTSLQKIFVEGLFDDVAEIGKWKIRMNVFERRDKDADRLKANKLRGR